MGLLDSGADCSLLGRGCEELILALNVEKLQSNSIVVTADGAPHAVANYVVLPVKFNNKLENIKFILMPNLSKKLILGIDFFSKFNIQIKHCGEITVPKIFNFVDDLGKTNTEELAEVISHFPKCSESSIGRTRLLEHKINTEDNLPIKQRHYPVSPYVQRDMDKEYDRMIKLGIIEESNSPWASPMVVVRKSNGKIRLCLDCRKLNSVTKKDSYPVPYISRILGNIRGTKFLSKIDLKDAFWQIGLEENSKEKTAFTIPGRGLYQFRVMPFGLSNAVQSQCRLMDAVLGFDMEPHVFAYLDDIIVATDSFEEHLNYLRKTAERLNRAGLTINVEKSEFCIPEIKYLGYILDKNGLRTDESKVQCIRDYPTPASAKDVKRFIGMTGWYRRFIQNFSTVVAPITNLMTKKAGKFKWTDEAEVSFTKIKDALCTSPVLAMADFAKPFILHTDASDVGIGGVLVQGEGNEEKVIGFMSHKLTSTQKKYSTTERECLAVLMAIEHFRPYVEGSKFSVITDHSSLIWLQNLKDPVGRLGRWILKLQQYDFKFIHRKGKFNLVPDALSRAFVSEIKLSLENFSIDAWYRDLKKNIELNPGKYPDFKIEQDLIFKHCETSKSFELEKYKWKLVVPETVRKEIMQQCHDDPGAAHMGFYKTLNKIKNEYYWPKMTKSIAEYVKLCDACKANKSPTYTLRHEMGEAKPLTHPWNVVAVDYLGPLPRSKNGNNFLFVAIDCFTKFIVLVPVRKGDSKNAIKVLRERVFCTFGVPEIIISDNGTPFISKQFEHFLEEHDVKQWRNAVYHPQHNPAERPNKVIAAAIRCYIGDDHRKWDEEVNKIASAINTAKHQSSRFSPYYLNFGKEMITSGKSHKLIRIKETITENVIEETPTDLKERMDDIRKKVVENLRVAYEKYSKPYNLRARIISFDPGEVVWRKEYTLSDATKNYSAKLAPKYVKCIIKKKLGKSTYQLTDMNGKALKNTYSTSDLKKN